MPNQTGGGRAYHYSYSVTMSSGRRRKGSADDPPSQKVDERWTDPDGNEISRDDPGLQASISATVAPIQVKLLTENLKLPLWVLERLSQDELRAGLALVLSEDQEERQRSREILLTGVERLIAEAKAKPAADVAGEQDAPATDPQRPSKESGGSTAASKRQRAQPRKSER